MSKGGKGASPKAAPRVGGVSLGAVVAEVVGTFILVFFGTGALVAVTLATGGDAANVIVIALAFGLALLVTVYAFGHVSGAHVNPAVTIALAAVRRFPWRAVPAYVVAQFAGAVLASLLVWGLFGDAGRADPVLLGATAPGEQGTWTAFLAEVVLGFVLVVVVLATATDTRANPAVAGLAIGFTIAVGILATLTISGASFNPARSLGPMIVAGGFPAWWAYLVAPTIGGLVGAFCYDFAIRRGAPPA